MYYTLGMLDTDCVLSTIVGEGAGRGEESGALTNGVGAPFALDDLEVLNEERIRQIDSLLALIVSSGHGELRLIIKDGKYRWIVPSVSLEAAW